MVSPRRQVEEQALRVQVVAGAFVDHRRQQVAQLDSPAAQVGQRQLDKTLALRRPEVDAGQQALPGDAVPGEGEELVPRRIAVPRGCDLALRPLAVAQLRTLQTLQDA